MTSLCAAGARARGFTLVELLVAAVVAAGILVAAYACLEAGLHSDKAMALRADALQNARVALMQLAADLRCATVLDDDLEFVGMSRELGGKEADNLDFAASRLSPRAPEEGDWREVSWYVDVDPETKERGLWRRVDPLPDNQPLAGGRREEVLPGVVSLKLEFYDGLFWYDEWGKTSGRPDAPQPTLLASNLSGMPDAVRITLVCAASSRLEPRQDEARADPEAPVALSTVVRLNLAPRAYELSTGGASGSNSSAIQGSSTTATEGGAR